MPEIYFGEVVHNRMWPRKYDLKHKVFFIKLDLLAQKHFPTLFGFNKTKLLSYFEKDHGSKIKKHNSNLEWIQDCLRQFDIQFTPQHLEVVCYPRLWFYVFNPVSFWLLKDHQNKIRYILVEVNNTFGERHSYLIEDLENFEIKNMKTYKSKKVFHVSPFMDLNGEYEFKFNIELNSFNVFINLIENGKTKISTRMTGVPIPLSNLGILKAVFGNPFMTFKTIAWIHIHAVILYLKGFKFFKKPSPPLQEISK